MAKIDENSRRKPAFSDGVSITLGDGAEWWFPKPYVEIRLSFAANRERPKFDNDAQRPVFGAGYWELLDEFYAAETGAERVEIVAAMAAHMLRQNYELSDDELAALLPYRAGSEANEIMWQTILDVAVGNSPKA